MINFKKFITKRVTDSSFFRDIDLSHHIDEYDIETPYDWYIIYLLLGDHNLHHNLHEFRHVANEYLTWRKRNPNLHVSCFIYFWKNAIVDYENFNEGITWPKLNAHFEHSSKAYGLLIEHLDKDVTVYAPNNKLILHKDISLINIEDDPILLANPPRIHISSHILRIQSQLSEIPDYVPLYNNTLELTMGNLKSLHGIEKKIKTVSRIFISTTTHVTHVLGLLLIEGLGFIHIIGDNEVSDILNHYLGAGRKGLIDCQNELIDAGFEEQAQL